LHFVGCTKGWKGQHHGGDWWAVVLPRATVNGSIIVENLTMNVTGIGYHDHNWEVSAKATLNFGWYWGRINSENYSITWTTILTTRMFKQPVLVINEKNGEYTPISSKEIWFTTDDYHFNNVMRVPHFLNIEAMTDDVFLVVDMQVIGVHHDRFMGFMNYWRYHIKCTGTIMVDGHAETIDGVFIAEYLRFR
jgi:predicted secreted hydrolase